MRTATLVLALSVTAMAIPAMVVAGTRITPIHAERLNLSAAVRQQLVLDDLHSILTGPTSPTSLATAPYASDEEGLCRRDWINLRYVRTGEGENASYKPVGLGSVSTQYQHLGKDAPSDPKRQQKACARLSGSAKGWVSSNEGDHYVLGALLFLALAVDDARAGQAVMECEDVEGDCGAAFLAAAPDIAATYRCVDNSPQCYEYQSDEYVVTLRFEYPGNDRRTIIKLAPAPILVT